MKKQKTPFVILGLLTIEPMSGYEIKKFISTSIGHFWAESNGQIYPSLRQLVREKFIVLVEKQQKGKQESHLYSITKEGQKALEQWLEETTDGKSIHRDEELLKLFFGKSSTSRGCIALLKKREERIKKTLDQYEEIQEGLKKHARSPHALYWNLTVRNGICHAKAELRWCQEAQSALKSGESR